MKSTTKYLISNYIAVFIFIILAAPYIVAMDGIASDMIASIHVSEDDKVLMYTEIELLKQLATELETNPDFWINLYAPPVLEPVPATGFLKTASLMSVGTTSGPVRYATSPRQGCKIDTRGVLASAVVGGFWSAIASAKVGAVAGTVTVPGIGTVTGAVSGFMAGFAFGFTTGAVTGVIGSLLLTCGR
ncbi:hypothetical protein SAMN04488511_10913 [Pedobacter suwonensis]|uniref:Uncharacterized protein n=1 Tax=Pedobacter suwonensis TaxID=332999 RepID=A0A1I0TEL3_9SPHI|nr:hypothetical protein [Pedobacter suwonensis]SFA50205.1 hypothetical protein SAMN04488511_10913 [Pedobacter suwonensis]